MLCGIEYFPAEGMMGKIRPDGFLGDSAWSSLEGIKREHLEPTQIMNERADCSIGLIVAPSSGDVHLDKRPSWRSEGMNVKEAFPRMKSKPGRNPLAAIFFPVVFPLILIYSLVLLGIVMGILALVLSWLI